jgi:hypothetical protein
MDQVDEEDVETRNRKLGQNDIGINHGGAHEQQKGERRDVGFEDFSK